ncbi:MAG: glycosyltransferase family 2 protein [Cytophagaceae bacterium]
MPAYNAAKFISDSIQSVLSQTFISWELIVIDDGSADNTSDIVKSFSEKDSRIKLLRQENGRQGKARNAGIKQSRGNLIALLDADDLWDHDKLERQMKVLEEQDVDFVFSNARILYDSSYSKIGSYPDFSSGMVTGKFSGKEMLLLLADSNRIVTLTAMFKKSAWDRCGGFEEELQYQNCEDYDMWLRMAYNGTSFYGMADVLGSYRRHNTGSTSNLISQLLPEINVIEKNNRLGIIPEDKRIKTLTWLYRVLVLEYYKSCQYGNIWNVVFKSNSFKSNPVSSFKLFCLAFYDIAVFLLKIPVKKILRKK